MRFIFIASAYLFLLFMPQQARACSCGPCEYDKPISELLFSRAIVPIIPLKSQAVSVRNETRNYTATILETETIILDAFGHDLPTRIILKSSTENGASCSKQPVIGVPQFASIWTAKNGYVSFSDCDCLLPVAAVIDYHKTGNDRFIPNPLKCKKLIPRKGCDVWEDHGPSDDYYYGFREARDYMPKDAELFPKASD